MPEESTACLAAPAANRVCLPRSFHRSSGSPSSVMSQFFTSAEILVGKRLASKMVVLATPDLLSLSPLHMVSTLWPMGLMHPIPVMTTRLLMQHLNPC